MHLPENILWALWEFSSLKKIINYNNNRIEIIHRGKYTGNHGGPDYSDISVKINGTLLNGSMEIDAEQSGWISHGHFSDHSFLPCVLHIHGSQSGSDTVSLSNGKQILSLPIDIILSESMQTALSGLISKGNLPRDTTLVCSGNLHRITSEISKKFLYELAIQRFQKKCRRFSDLYYNSAQNVNLLYSLTSDAEYIWKYTISSMIFRAMGYSANSGLMEDLFSLINPHFFTDYSKNPNFPEYLEAYVWELTGLLPELSEVEESEAISYLRNLKERWEEVKLYLNASRISRYQWKTRSLRPNASVYLRIYTAVKIVAVLWQDGFTALFHYEDTQTDIKDYQNRLAEILRTDAGNFWSQHSSFTKKTPGRIHTLPGESRIQEILINVLLPGLYAYYSSTDNSRMTEICRNIYLEMKIPKYPGSIAKILNELLHGEKTGTAVYYQGAVELSNEYCRKGKCEECKIGGLVF